MYTNIFLQRNYILIISQVDILSLSYVYKTSLTHVTNKLCVQVIEERASKITAHIRGYLTRALLNSYKVQQHIKTVRDTQEILSGYGLCSEMSAQDRAFYDRY